MPPPSPPKQCWTFYPYSTNAINIEWWGKGGGFLKLRLNITIFCQVIGSVADVLSRIVGSMKTMIKRPSSTPKHKNLRMEWSRKYVKTDMKFVIFTDELKASLDDPDGWAKGCVFNGDNCPNRIRRQQGGGGVMIWGGIIGNAIIGSFRVPEGLKLSSATYCQFLKNSL